MKRSLRMATVAMVAACMFGGDVTSVHATKPSSAVYEEEELSESFVVLAKNAALIRSEASEESQVLNVILPMQAIRVLEEEGEWYVFRYGTQKAYLKQEDFLAGQEMDAFVRVNSDEFTSVVEVVNKTALWSMNQQVQLGTVEVGEQFVLQESENEEWYEISFDGVSALISKADCKLVTKVNVICFAKKIESDGTGSSVVEMACQFLGNPYVWGGNSLVNGVDCSGFVVQIYKQFGIDMPRCSWQQATVGESVGLDELQPGDLVFYKRGSRIGHVAIYAGDGKIVHAKGRKYGIVTDDLWYSTPVCATRVLEQN